VEGAAGNEVHVAMEAPVHAEPNTVGLLARTGLDLIPGPLVDLRKDVVRGQEDAAARPEAEDCGAHVFELVLGQLALAVVDVGRNELVETASQVAAVDRIFLAPAPDQRALDEIGRASCRERRKM